MKNMFSRKYFVRAATLVFGVGCSLSTVHAQSTGPASYTVNSGGLESFDLRIDTTSFSGALAGAISLVNSTPGNSFLSVCTDISGTLYLGGTYSYAAPVSFQNQQGIDPTWGAANANSPPNPVVTADAVAGIQAAAGVFYKFQGVMTEATTIGGLSGETVLDDKAALQLAVWAALYNTSANQVGPTLLSGLNTRFKVLGVSSDSGSGSWGSYSAGTQNAITEAQAMLNAINYKDLYSGNIISPDPQSQNGGYSTEAIIAQEVLANVTPVPEATTIVAGGLLLLPFAASTLRLSWNRRKKTFKTA